MQLVAWGGGHQQRRPCLPQPRRPPFRRPRPPPALRFHTLTLCCTAVGTSGKGPTLSYAAVTRHICCSKGPCKPTHRRQLGARRQPLSRRRSMHGEQPAAALLHPPAAQTPRPAALQPPTWHAGPAAGCRGQTARCHAASLPPHAAAAPARRLRAPSPPLAPWPAGQHVHALQWPQLLSAHSGAGLRCGLHAWHSTAARWARPAATSSMIQQPAC